MAYPILAPNSSWYKGTTLRSDITLINIVDNYSPTGDEIEIWNADVNDSGDIKCYITGTTLTIAGNGSGKIAANEDAKCMFSDATYKSYFTNVTAINNLSLIDTSNVLTFMGCFDSCRKVTTLDVDSWDVSKATDISSMFLYCLELQSVDVSNWNVVNEKSIYQMFAYCKKLKRLDLSKWKVKPISSRHMFVLCSSLTTIGDVSNWDMSECKYMQSMFGSCSALTNIDISKWDISKVININSMFQECSSLENLDVSNWDVSNVEDMSFIFWGCGKLKEIDVSKWNTSKVTNIDHFAAHANLVRKGMEKWNTSSLVNANAAFHQCGEEELDLSGWDVSNVQFFSQMFENSTKLKRIKGLEKWNTSNALVFDEMFGRCSALEELDLSGWDTRKAKKGVQSSSNGHSGSLFNNMFQNCTSLKKVKLGENFSINGDGTNTTASYKFILPTPSSDYIEGADGYWYTLNGDKYATNGVKDKTAETYYASYNLIADEDVIIKNGSMLETAKAIRTANGTDNKYLPSQFAEGVDSVKNIIAELIDGSITELVIPDNVTSIINHAFYYRANMTLSSLPDQITDIKGYAFHNCRKLNISSLPRELDRIEDYAFSYCTALTSLTFKRKPSFISSIAFTGSTNLTTINVPWAEGEVDGAPWGATNATINYNYIPEV